MTAHRKIQFIVADGSRARWVARSVDADDFVTSFEMEAAHRLPGHPQGVVFEGVSHARFSVEESQGAARQHHEAFARELAEMINDRADQGAFERLAIVAPARTLGAVLNHLGAAAKAKLVTTLAKDLTGKPDHALGRWLRPIEAS